MEINSAFWQLIKNKIIQRNKDNKLVETWLDPVVFLEQTGAAERPKIILSVPSQLHQYFIIENLLEKIYVEISEELQLPFEVDLVISGHKSSFLQDVVPNHHLGISEQNAQQEFPFFNPKSSQQNNNTSEKTSSSPSIYGQSAQSSQAYPSNVKPVDKNREILNPEYTFSTFVVGKNTEFAHAASYNVAQNPGAGYNPLFIFGPVGMGKTHLIHAVGNQIKTSYPHLKIAYIGAERFLNECVSSIRHKEMDKFRQKYRDSYDIFLVDDVQYIGRGETVQEEFFHTVNSFIDRKKQCVVASDRMPKDIQGLEDRLKSRLEWGLMADISMPDIETRVAILKYKAERLGLRLNEDVINYIARISKRSIRELEGNLKTVKMFSELQGLSIDISLAKKVLASRETQTTISAEDIQKIVAEHYQIRMNDLKSTSRSKSILIPRQISMYLIKKHLDKPYVDIGHLFGGKDHTTVMNAIDRIEDLQSKNIDLKNDIEEITNRIHNITGL